jgi:hypothetical protein
MGEIIKIWDKLKDGQRLALIRGLSKVRHEAHTSTVISLADKGLVIRGNSIPGTRKLSYTPTPLGIEVGEYGYKSERGES